MNSATTRFVAMDQLDYNFDPFVIAEVPDEALPEIVESLGSESSTFREQRMLRLASTAFQGCRDAIRVAGVDSPTLLLALPELDTTRPVAGDLFLQKLSKQLSLTIDASHSDATFRGRAGGLQAIGRAAQLIRQGLTDVAIVGGVDTYRDLYILGTLEMEERVKTEQNSDGFIPGEAAAFLLLANRSKSTAPALAGISAVAEGVETGHLYSEEPYRGDGLAAVIAEVTAGLAAPIQDVYSSMNGENHWAKEWGVAHLRNSRAFKPEHGMHHPADCYGEVGAASGPLLVGLAALGIQGGYRYPPVLVYCSSDRGERAALLVERV